MTLTQVLELNDSAQHPLALEHNLGDHVLCARNRVYAGIRRRAADLGVRFTASGPLWRDYTGFPLLCLDDLMARREVPYVDNVSVFRRLIRDGRDPVLADSLLRDGLKRNYLLHESAHVVFSCEQQAPDLAGVNPALLASIGSEAFANAIEQLSFGCSDGAAHDLLLSLNTYTLHHRIISRLIAEVVNLVTVEALLPYAFVCYFLANQMNYQPSAAAILAILKLYPFEGVDTRTAAFRNVLTRFTLNSVFVNETSVAYFSMLGLEAEFRSLDWRDFLKPGPHAEWLYALADRTRQLILFPNTTPEVGISGLDGFSRHHPPAQALAVS